MPGTYTRRAEVPPDQTNPGGDGKGSSLERVTVNLTPKSVAAMNRITQLTGDTKTEAINKALQFYGHIQEFLDAEGSLYMRDHGSTELERIKIF